MIAVRRWMVLALAAGGATMGVGSSAAAQRREPAGIGSAVPMPDTSAVPLPRKAVGNDTTRKPPLSPKRAFLTSLLLPGYAQSKLDRPTASMIYAAFEVLCIGMLRKSAQDLNEAKRYPKDSVFVPVRVDPNTGQVILNGYVQSPFTTEKINARRTHYEDWFAALIFNHIISSADAYVSANLWDFRANVNVDPEKKQAKFGVRKSF